MQALTYQVIEDENNPTDWRAEAIDAAGEGECYVVTFTGRRAEERAREYAQWKNRAKKEAREIRENSELSNATEHVSYEIDMMIYAAKRVGGWYSSPRSTPAAGNEKKVALESFLLHFRNLRAFLFPSLQRGQPKREDIVASDFLEESTARDVGNPASFVGDKDRLDRMLAHLTYYRRRYIEAGEEGWRAARMAAEMLTQFDALLSSPSLKPKTASYFRSRSELAVERSHLAYIASLAPEPELKGE